LEARLAASRQEREEAGNICAKLCCFLIIVIIVLGLKVMKVIAHAKANEDEY